MPNRILRDTALDSDRIAAVDEGSEVLFYRLLMLADDFGRFDGRPSVIRGRAFALRQTITEKEIERRLAQLSKFQLILRYQVDGKPYISIPRFGQRQRAEKSKFPSPDSNPPSNDGQLSDKGQTSAHVVVVEGVYEGVVVNEGEVVVEGGGEDQKRTDAASRRGPRKGNGTAKTHEAEGAYREAIQARYGSDPGALNARQRGMLARFVDLVPSEEVSSIIKHYVASNRGYYVSRSHCINMLLRDAESLRMSCRNGFSITDTEARQGDRTQANYDAFAPLIAEAREREKNGTK